MALTAIDRYQLVDEIGRGGMAIVYRAVDPRFRRDVAVKVMTGQMEQDPTLRARFEREAQTIAALEHPAIVPVYDFGEDAGRPYLVMRLMTGGTLADRLKTGALAIDETARILNRIGSALERAHQEGIVHRDLKPSNILFDQYGDAFLTDFGIARLAESSVTLTGEAVIGTPDYMSPEQVHGDRQIDGRSDIYALGVITFEMLTGQRPYHADTPAKTMMRHLMDPVPDIRQVRPDLPQAVDTVITRSMAKEPAERFKTATELTMSLSAISAATLGPLVPPPDETVAAKPPVKPEAGPQTEPAETVPEADGGEPAAELAGEALAEPVNEISAEPETEPVVEPEVEAGAVTEVAGPEMDQAETVLESSLPQTEVAPPPEIAGPAEVGAPVPSGRPARSRPKWLWPVAGAAIVLIVAAVVVAVILSGRSGQNETASETGHSPVAETQAPPESTEPAAVTGGEENQDQGEVMSDAQAAEAATVEAEERSRAEAFEPFFSKLESGDVEGALALADELVAAYPQDAAAYTQRSEVRRMLGDLDGALADAEQAVALAPEAAGGYLALGTAQREMGQLPEALDSNQRALQLNEADPNAHFQLGLTLRAMGNLPEALAELTLAAELMPEEGAVHTVRADLLREMGRPEEALAELARAVELDPENPDLQANLASLLLFDLNRPDEAVEHYGQAIALDPDNGRRFTDRAIAYRFMGDADAALADHERAVRLSPDDPQAHFERALTVLDLLGDPEAALDDLNQALEMDPGWADAYALRGQIYYQHLDDLDRALADFDKAVELAPESDWILASRAAFFRDTGDADAALADYSRAIEVAPDNPANYLERGDLYLNAFNEPDPGVADFDRAVHLRPDDPTVYLSRAQALAWALGDYDPALADLEHCLALDPDLYWCYYEKARIFDALGDTGAAAENYRAYLDHVYEPDCPECQEEAARYLEEKGP